MFDNIRDLQIEKEFTQFWIKQMKGMSRIIEESLLSGMVRCLFVHQHMSFGELRANFLNNQEKSRRSKNPSTDKNTLEYEIIKDTFFTINFKNMKFHNYIGEHETPIHKIDLADVLEASYSCVELAIRYRSLLIQ